MRPRPSERHPPARADLQIHTLTFSCNTWTISSSSDSESLPRANRPERARRERIRLGAVRMLMTKAKPPATRTLRGWRARCCRAGATEECEVHGWVRGRAGPHARERAYDIARAERPPGISPQAAAVAEA